MWEYADSVSDAFPAALRNDLEQLTSSTRIVGGYKHKPLGSFLVSINSEILQIPERVYFGKLHSYKSLPTIQRHLADCIYTRHHDGYVREDNLRKIILVNESWVAPFVLRLLGEYVIEIIRVIYSHQHKIDMSLYSDFIRENPEFYRVIQSRVVSYWDCYYRSSVVPKSEYVGFKVIEAFDNSI